MLRRLMRSSGKWTQCELALLLPLVPVVARQAPIFCRSQSSNPVCQVLLRLGVDDSDLAEIVCGAAGQSDDVDIQQLFRSGEQFELVPSLELFVAV